LFTNHIIYTHAITGVYLISQTIRFLGLSLVDSIYTQDIFAGRMLSKSGLIIIRGFSLLI